MSTSTFQQAEYREQQEREAQLTEMFRQARPLPHCQNMLGFQAIPHTSGLPPLPPPTSAETLRRLLEILGQLPHDPPADPRLDKAMAARDPQQESGREKAIRRFHEFMDRHGTSPQPRDTQEAMVFQNEFERRAATAPLAAAPPAPRRRVFLRLCRRVARWIERLDL